LGATVIPAQLSKHDLPRSKESLVLAQLPVGNYQIWISGQNNTNGAFAMSIYWAGMPMAIILSTRRMPS